MINELVQLIPRILHANSGKVFYSGRLAFSSPSRLYVLGLNPGGDPVKQTTETVAAHTQEVLTLKPHDWSAYRDESWGDTIPGTHKMQPRVLHLFARLGLAPGMVPCSNLVFVRSRREKNLEGNTQSLADLCWPFHARVIELLRPRAILCLGQTAGKYVKKRLGATIQLDEFVEINNRKWRTTVFASNSGVNVILATHPSIADWTVSQTDPSSLVKKVLDL